MTKLGAILTVMMGAMGQQGPLVATAWLAGQIGSPDLVVLHVGTEKDYAEGHIAGARLVRLMDIGVTDAQGLRLQLPAVDALQKTLGVVGVSDTSRIVVYAGNVSVQSATRVWFTLDYLGLGNRSSLLDGGLAAWRAEGRPVSTETSAPLAASFTAKPRPELVATADWIRSKLADPEFVLIDARTEEFYSGASAGSMPRAGRIPGARNVPFPSVFGADGKMKPKAELARMIGSKPVVTYCHIGQQATVVYFVARYLGLEARLYDGSFQEWSGRKELPVQ
ncbi:MAG: sulfurtransferase [Bryobacterales bacterium]|nr:sulfurtransferase [Bryobacterales bacterium]